MRMFIAFLRDRTAATSIEYAIIAAGIALAIVVAVTNLGTSAQGLFDAVATATK